MKVLIGVGKEKIGMEELMVKEEKKEKDCKQDDEVSIIHEKPFKSSSDIGEGFENYVSGSKHHRGLGNNEGTGRGARPLG